MLCQVPTDLYFVSNLTKYAIIIIKMTTKKAGVIGLAVLLGVLIITSLWFLRYHSAMVVVNRLLLGASIVVCICLWLRIRAFLNTRSVPEKPSKFIDSLWVPILVMTPIVVFEMYGLWRFNDRYPPVSRVLLTIASTQYFVVLFYGAAIIGWAWVRWIEKRDPSFFEEDSSRLSIPVRDEDIKAETLGGFYFTLIAFSVLILINIFLIPPMYRVTDLLIVMGSIILGINLWGLISIKTLKGLTRYVKIK